EDGVRRAVATCSFFLQHKDELPLLGSCRQQLMPGLAGKGLEVSHRARIGGEHAQHLSRSHLVERLLGAEYRQRAVQPARIELAVEIHKAPVSLEPSMANLPATKRLRRLADYKTVRSLSDRAMRRPVQSGRQTGSTRSSPLRDRARCSEPAAG